TTRRSSWTARAGSAACSSVCVQTTRSKLASGTGIASTVPSSSASGFAMSTPTYSLTTPAQNGAYGLMPQPISSSPGRSGRCAASSTCCCNHVASGLRTAYVREPTSGRLRASPGSATSGQSERDPRQRVEREAGDDALRRPQPADCEHPEQRRDADRRSDSSRRESHGAEEHRGEQQEADDTEVRERLHVEVLHAVETCRRRKDERRLGRKLPLRDRHVVHEARGIAGCLPPDAGDRA